MILAVMQSVTAQEIEKVAPTALAEKPAIEWTMDGGLQHRFDTDADSGGEFNASSFKFGIGMQKPLTDRLGLDVYASYAQDAYDFETSEELGGKPWEDINTVRIRAFLRYQEDPQWVFLGGPLLFASEEQDAKEDSMEGGVMVGVMHLHSRDLIVGVGLIALSQLEDDTLVLPFPLVHWSFAEEWTFTTGATDVGANTGPGLEVTWKCSPEWRYSAGAQLQRRRFRLDDAGVAPDGVGEDLSVPAYLQTSWRPSEATVVEVVAGIHLSGELTLEDDSGDEIASEDYDPGAMLGVRASLVF